LPFHLTDLNFQNPVIITQSDAVASARKWSLDYLQENMGESPCTVFQSKSHKFKFYDDKKADLFQSTYKMEFTPPTRRIDITVADFHSRLKNWREGEDRLVSLRLRKNGLKI